MTKAEQYFKEQMNNEKFAKVYGEISKQVDLEWELERLKNQVKNNAEKSIIIQELEKLQEFVRNTMFLTNQKITG
jgi:hypothetical protein